MNEMSENWETKMQFARSILLEWINWERIFYLGKCDDLNK